jgi:hypothetical protein
MYFARPAQLNIQLSDTTAFIQIIRGVPRRQDAPQIRIVSRVLELEAKRELQVALAATNTASLGGYFPEV